MAILQLNRFDSSLRMVVFDNPLKIWDLDITQQLFKRLVQLKIAGYHTEYPPNMLPVDATDFFGTHLMICRTESDRSLTPIVSYRSVTLKRCDERRQVFPPLAILRASGESDLPVADVVKYCRERNVEVSYDSSWTMRPEVRSNRELSKQLRDMTTAIGAWYHRDFQVPEWVVMGIKRFKTDQYFRWAGCSDITSEFRAYGSFDEPAFLLHMKHLSPEAYEVAERLRSLWENKLVVSADALESGKFGVAA